MIPLPRALPIARSAVQVGHHAQTAMDAQVPRPRSPRSREAIRVAGETWRHLHSSVGDPCRDCGRCDLGADGHDAHECRITPAWFAGVATVCHGCFANLVRIELRTQEVDLVGIPERVARGDADALDDLRRVIDTDGASA